MRKKLNASSARIRNSRIPSSKLTLRLQLWTNRFAILPAEKREEYIVILDNQIKRLTKIINSARAVLNSISHYHALS